MRPDRCAALVAGCVSEANGTHHALMHFSSQWYEQRIWGKSAELLEKVGELGGAWDLLINLNWMVWTALTSLACWKKGGNLLESSLKSSGRIQARLAASPDRASSL